MTDNFLFGISLTASFLAGNLALFAPCCLTFLLPAYLGTIFKENKKVVFYTLIFAMGLSSILIPVALGFRLLIDFFNFYHQGLYYLGAVLLIFMGLTTIKPFFHLPQVFHKSSSLNGQANTFSVFSLGVISGITSSCCAPVLFAAVTLTSLSPTLFQAVIVSIAYVLGIVFPLFFLSLGYRKTLQKIDAKKRRKIYTVLKVIGGGIFMISGVLIAVLTFLGKIQMYQMESYSLTIRKTVFNLAGYFQNSLVDLFVFGFILWCFYKALRKVEE